MRLRGARVLTQHDVCDPQPELTTVGLSKWAVDIRESMIRHCVRALAYTLMHRVPIQTQRNAWRRKSTAVGVS